MLTPDVVLQIIQIIKRLNAMGTENLTGNQRYKPTKFLFGGIKLILQVEVLFTNGTSDDLEPLNPHLYWRDAKLEDFSAIAVNGKVAPNGPEIDNGTTALPDELISFLMGIAHIDNVAFGEFSVDRPGRFWWRREIQKYINPDKLLKPPYNNIAKLS